MTNMPCLKCGAPTTCRSHILPKSLGRWIIERSPGRKTLSLAAPDRRQDNFQSGMTDSSILCAACDGKLGEADNHATEIIRLLGTDHETIDVARSSFALHRPHGVHHHLLARFASSVVWRHSVAQYRELKEFSLGPNEPWMKELAFPGSEEVATVVVARLIGATPETEHAALTAMSYPVSIFWENRRCARFVAGGLMFLVQTSRRPSGKLKALSVTTSGRALGELVLAGQLMPFEKLGDLPQVMNSKYVQDTLKPR